MDIWLLPKLVFGFRNRISRSTYIGLGAALVALRFWLEWLVLRDAGFGLVDYLTPVFLRRPELYAHLGSLADVALSLPFLWVGFSLSARRAIDAKLSPTVAYLFLVPVVQFALMAVLVALPSSSLEIGTVETPGDYRGASRQGGVVSRLVPPLPVAHMEVVQAVVLAGLVLFGTCATTATATSANYGLAIVLSVGTFVIGLMGCKRSNAEHAALIRERAARTGASGAGRAADLKKALVSAGFPAELPPRARRTLWGLFGCLGVGVVLVALAALPRDIVYWASLTAITAPYYIVVYGSRFALLPLGGYLLLGVYRESGERDRVLVPASAATDGAGEPVLPTPHDAAPRDPHVPHT